MFLVFASPVPLLLLISIHYRIDRRDYCKFHTVSGPYLQVLHLDSTNCGSKIFGGKSDVVDVSYVVSPTMFASVLNMYRIFSYHYFLSNTVYKLFI